MLNKFSDISSENEEMLSYFSSIVETSYDAIIVESLDGIVLSWNKAAERIYGYGDHEMVGSSIFNIIPEHKKEEYKIILKRISSGEKIENFETERVRKNGDKVVLSAVISPIKDKDNKILWLSVIARDITDFKAMEIELRDSNERLKNFIEYMPALLYLKDKFTRNIILSKKFRDIVNSPSEDLSGKTNEQIWGREIGRQMTIDDMKVLRLNQGEFVEKEEIFNVNGKDSTYITCKFPIHQGGGKHFIGGISIDVTKSKEDERKLQQSYEELSAVHEELTATEEELRLQYNALLDSEKQLKRSERRYQLVVESSNDGIWDIDIRNKKVFISDRFKEILGINIGNNILDLSQLEKYLIQVVKCDINNRIREYIKKGFNSNTYNEEFKIITGEGKDRYIFCRGKAVYDKHRKPIYMAGSVTDITDRKKYEKVIENLAYASTVTGLYNRTYVMNKFPRLLKEIKDANEKAAFIFVDIDNFKAINDTMGHLAGDEFLKKISNDFKSLIKSDDHVCHLGGDEFLFLIRRVKDRNEVDNMAKELLNIFKKPFTINGHDIYYITASVGLTMIPDYGYDLEMLFNHCDDAMYYVKKRGKNDYTFYKEAMDSTIYKETKLLNELKSALYNNEFKVFYQPKVKADTGEIVGMEALVRWQKEDGTIVPPSKFINFAEEKGIIVLIGEYVMKMACLQNVEWQRKGFRCLRVAVNLSTCQLADENLFTKIESILKETGLPPQYLEVEITETMIMRNFEVSTDTLNKLRKIGVKISLDDFGTGYSSLNYLKQLPINCVKIDKLFIDNIIIDEKERFVANSLINLFHGLGLTVVAEGVEEEEQYDLLKEYRCDEIQGYYFSKPVNASEFENMIKFY